MNKLTKYLACSISAVALTLLASCGGSSSDKKSADTAKSAHNTLTYCMPGTFSKIEPGTTSLAMDVNFIAAVTEGLYGFEQTSAKKKPQLATSYDVSGDNLTYTFHLRKGVKWHTTKYFTPTREFNADDVKFSLDRQIDTNNPFYKAEYTFVRGLGIADVIKEVQKVDDYTVKIILNKPMATLVPNMLAVHIFGLVSKEYFETMKEKGDLEFAYRNPIGTGPWKFVDNHDGQATRFTRNEEYWGEKTTMKNLVMRAVTDPSQYLNAIEAGECDVTNMIQSTDVKTADKYKNVTVVPQDVLRTWYVTINHKSQPALKNKYVRQAIAYAIDRNRLIDEVYGGNGKPATSLIPPGIFAHLGESFHYSYNVNKAKELLAKAGYANGKGIKEIEYMIRASDPQYRKIALNLQRDLQAIGLKLKIVSMEWSTMIGRLKAGQYDVMGLSWGADFADPDNFYSNLVGKPGPSNRPNWDNAKFLDYITQAATVGDEEKRLELYKKATKIYADEMPLIPILYPKAFVATSKHIHNYIVGPMTASLTSALAYVEYK